MKVNIKQPENEEIPVDVLAEHIRKLSNIGKQLQNSKLKPKAVILLLQHMTGLRQGDIELVLNALPALERTYLK